MTLRTKPGKKLVNKPLILKDEVAALSEEHRQYLLARHGTLDLDPIPDMTDADPYNWSQTKVGHSRVSTSHKRCSISGHIGG